MNDSEAWCTVSEVLPGQQSFSVPQNSCLTGVCLGPSEACPDVVELVYLSEHDCSSPVSSLVVLGSTQKPEALQTPWPFFCCEM